MRIDYKGDGVCEFEGNEEEMAHVYGQGIAFMMLKGLYDMDDNDALSAFKSYAELHLKVDRPVEDVPDSWAYWSPGDIK